MCGDDPVAIERKCFQPFLLLVPGLIFCRSRDSEGFKGFRTGIQDKGFRTDEITPLLSEAAGVSGVISSVTNLIRPHASLGITG